MLVRVLMMASSALGGAPAGPDNVYTTLDTASVTASLQSGSYDLIVVTPSNSNYEPVLEQVSNNVSFTGGEYTLNGVVLEPVKDGPTADVSFTSGEYRAIVLTGYDSDDAEATVNMTSGEYYLVVVEEPDTVQEQGSASVAFTGGSYDAA